MSDNIARHDGKAAALAVPIRNVEDLLFLGSVLAASGFFKNTVGENQAAAKILAGMELGISPVASLRGLYIVEGQITLAYPLIGALIKKSGKYDYRIRENTAEACVIEFFENGESVGFSALTMKQARERGLDKTYKGGTKEPWVKFPENMLLSKCLSNGAKAYASEIFFGSVYTPDELGAEVDGATGDVIAIEPDLSLEVRALIPCQGEDCESPNRLIVDFTNEQGKTMSAEKIAERTVVKYGIALCWDCAQKAKKAEEKTEEREPHVAPSDTPEAARKRYEEACNLARQLELVTGKSADYRNWNSSQLNAATEALHDAIKNSISSTALEDDGFLAENNEDGLPDDDAPLSEWMAFAAAWELIQTIRAENLNMTFELDAKEEVAR